MDCRSKIPFDEIKAQMDSYTSSQQGLRNSSKREMVLRVLYDKSTHLSPDEVYREIRDKMDSKIGISTVYRILSLLADAGILRQIALDADSRRYEINCGDHHDHLICTKCGEIVEFFDEELEKIQELIAKKYGYALEDHEMKLLGTCQACQKRASK